MIYIIKFITLFVCLFLFFLNRWAQGYDGSPALFVNRDTICFVCGNNVKFVNIKDKRESVLASPGDGIGALAVNPSYSNFAFAELEVNPKVFVYAFPDFSRPRSTLEGEEVHWHLDVTSSSSKSIMRSITCYVFIAHGW